MSPEEKIIERLGAENGALRSRIEILEYRISNLVGRDGVMNRLGLTGSEYRLVHLMANSAPRVVTRDAMLEARRPDAAHRPEDVDAKLVDVFICKIRPKLAKYGLTVHTTYGAGYCMSEQDGERFCELTYGTPLLDQANGRAAA